MKNTFTTAVFALALAGLATVPASAQDHLKATVPFGFRAGGQDLPAGTYEIEKMRGVVSTNAYRIADSDHKVKATVVMSAHEIQKGDVKPAHLAFACTSNGCSLAEIWNGTAVGDRLFVKPSPKNQEVSMVAVRLGSGSAK